MKRTRVALMLSAWFAMGPLGCESETTYPKIDIISGVFGHNEVIPKNYSCEGEGLSPPLSLRQFDRETTRSFVVIVDDPEGDPEAPDGTAIHWVIWGITAASPFLPTGIPRGGRPVETMTWVQGINSAESIGYLPPCPPKGERHTFHFKGYALDIEELPVEPGATRDEVLGAMQGHIIGYDVLKGSYRRN